MPLAAWIEGRLRPCLKSQPAGLIFKLNRGHAVTVSSYLLCSQTRKVPDGRASMDETPRTRTSSARSWQVSRNKIRTNSARDSDLAMKRTSGACMRGAFHPHWQGREGGWSLSTRTGLARQGLGPTRPGADTTAAYYFFIFLRAASLLVLTLCREDPLWGPERPPQGP
jgi:hypothetical protein